MRSQTPIILPRFKVATRTSRQIGKTDDEKAKPVCGFGPQGSSCMLASITWSEQCCTIVSTAGILLTSRRMRHPDGLFLPAQRRGWPHVVGSAPSAEDGPPGPGSNHHQRHHHREQESRGRQRGPEAISRVDIIMQQGSKNVIESSKNKGSTEKTSLARPQKTHIMAMGSSPPCFSVGRWCFAAIPMTQRNSLSEGEPYDNR